jgi:hypothetical protein
MSQTTALPANSSSSNGEVSAETNGDAGDDSEEDISDAAYDRRHTGALLVMKTQIEAMRLRYRSLATPVRPRSRTLLIHHIMATYMNAYCTLVGGAVRYT